MRAYWTILRDSFHEAMVSRVMWIVLLLITLFLAVLAPLGIDEQAGSYLGIGDVWDPVGLVDQLREEGEAARPSPSKRIWSLLSNTARQEFSKPNSKDAPPGQIFLRSNQLREELNRQLTERQLYDAESWNKLPIGREARELLETGPDHLPSDELARLNRLLLEAAYPGKIAASERKQVRLSYLVWDLSIFPPIGLEDLHKYIKVLLDWFMYFFLGVGGVLIAILLTSSMIPQTYEAGAIDLLLSKPVSRSLVYLTKFFGGCMYILLNAAFFIAGIWFILGWRFDFWHPRLLWCIPMYLFLFAIYYAVSALVGVIWRNAIICVVLTVLFWAGCWLLDFTKRTWETGLIAPTRIVNLIPTDDTVLAMNQAGETLRWDQSSRRWLEVFAAPPDRHPIGPFGAINIPRPIVAAYDAPQKRLVAVDAPRQQFMQMARNNPLWIGRSEQNWQRTAGVAAPPATDALIVDSQGSVLAISPQGVFRLQGKADAKPKTVEILGFQIPLKDTGGRFVEASAALPLYAPLSASLDRTSSELAIFDGRKLLMMTPNDKSDFLVRRELEFETPQIGLVAYARDTVVLALADGEIRVYDATELQERTVFPSKHKSPPRLATASPDGRWIAVVFHDGRFWLYDAQRKQVSDISVTGQGDISSVAFNEQNHMLLTDQYTRVTEYSPTDGKIISRLQPAFEFWDTAYHYVVAPLYSVLPKPGQLNYVIMFILTDENTFLVNGQQFDLRAARETIDVSGIVGSNLAFLAIVLGIGCVYVARKDF